MKSLIVLITLLSLLGCADTEDPLSAEDVDQMITEALAKLDNDETLAPEEIDRLINDAIIESVYQTPQRIKKAVSDSIVYLHIITTDGKSKTGTGFVVKSGGYIATCNHVIENTSTRSAIFSIYDDVAHSITSIAATDKAHDIAIIKTTFNAPPLRLGDSDAIRSGDFVYAVGNPHQLKGTLSEGIISAIRPNGFWIVKDRVFQMTIPLSPGSSGGPILNQHAEVIGVAYASHYVGQNLNFAIPVTHLKSLIASMR